MADEIAEQIMEEITEDEKKESGAHKSEISGISSPRKSKDFLDQKIPKNEEDFLGSNEPREEAKIFDIYDINEVVVTDLGLKNIINLDFKLLVKSHGRASEKHGKIHVNLIERLINMLGVPGHRGKKHKIGTKWASGKYNRNAKIVLDAFKIISKKTGKNPIQILVQATENGSPRDEVTMIQYGGARYPQAIDCSPMRRVSIALRNIVHGSYDKAFNRKKTIAEALADELIATANMSADSFSHTKRNDMEKQADGAR